MNANTFGTHYQLTSAGESHGKAYVGIVDGVPAGLNLTESDIQPYLDARRPGADSTTSQRKESDTLEFLSGLFEGKTTGAPIAFIIPNQNARSSDYDELKDVYRPGHADYTYHQKYGIRDHRGGGRASARETCLRVVSGGIAEHFLKTQGINFEASLKKIGDTLITSPEQVEAIIEQLRRDKDSIGATVEVKAIGVPVGLGEPLFNKLDAGIAFAMMGIPAVKAVEIGDGLACSAQKGSEHRDAMTADGFKSNHAGGILGGISTGQDIRVTVTFKPTSSIPQPIETLNTDQEPTLVTVKGRHDPCVGIRGVPVARAMLAHVVMDYFLAHRVRMSF